MAVSKKILFGIILPLMLILIPITTPLMSGGAAKAALSDVDQACKNKAEQAFGGADYAQNNKLVITGPENDVYTCTAYSRLNNDRRAYWYFNETGQPATVNGITGENLFDGDRATYNAEGKKVAPPTDCDSWINYAGSFGNCIFRTFVSGLGAVLMSLTAWLLGLAGLLFDWLVYHTIMVFADSFYNTVSTGINAGWTIFRDVGNILIIGLFVFIAISMILGLKTYGDKKLVANLILIAVLVNFSLLFTKIIVDFSNFTAKQFYTAAKFDLRGTDSNGPTNNIGTLQPGDSKCTHNPTSGFTKCGIAGAFIAMSGVTGLGDAYDKLNSVAKTSDNGWKALLYGLISATLFLGAALILFYGSYIILVRAMLIIFLLLTSSLAFASYIIPNKLFVEKGWKLWWDSLLKIAVLAPLLMVFLFIITQIIATLNINGTGTTLGKLASDPSSNTIGALFNYLIVLGLLFASFKISNSIASSVAGMNVSSMMAGVTKVASTVAGVPGVGYVLGRFGYGRADSLQAKAQSATRSGALSFNEAQTQKAAAAEHDRLAKEARESGAGEHVVRWREDQAKKARAEESRLMAISSKQDRLASRYGRRSARAADWTSTKSFSKRVKTRVDAASGAVKRATPDKDKLRSDEEKRVAEQRAPDLQRQKTVVDEAVRAAAAQNQVYGTAQTQRDEAQKKRGEALLEAAKAAGHDHSDLTPKMPDGLLKAFKDQIATIGDASKRTNIETRLNSAKSPDDMKALREEITSAVSEPVRDATRATLTRAANEHESGMRLESARIEAVRNRLVQQAVADDAVKAHPDVQNAEKALTAAQDLFTVATRHRTEANANERKQKSELTRLEGEITNAAKKAGNDAVDAVTETAKRVAERVGARGVGLIPNILDRSTTAAATVKAVRTKKREERLSDIIKEVAEEQRGESTTPPVIPPTGPTT